MFFFNFSNHIEKYSDGGNVDDNKYQVVDGTAYHKNTPKEVIDVLEKVRKNNIRIKIYYGDVETGRDWAEENDTVGTIGRSNGAYKIPLLIKTGRSNSGGGILDNCIVKIKDTKTGSVLYQNSKYNAPTVEIVPSDMEGYTHNTIVNGDIYGRHKSLKSAELLAGKLKEDGGILDSFKDGGDAYGSLEAQNEKMALNLNKSIAHHSIELGESVKRNPKVPSWALAKLERAATDMADITHYLDGRAPGEFLKGGETK